MVIKQWKITRTPSENPIKVIGTITMSTAILRLFIDLKTMPTSDVSIPEMVTYFPSVTTSTILKTND